jgi:hypothetical protein
VIRLQPGDLLVVDGRASVQFAGDRALLLRVTAVSTAPTYHGWVWLTGYVVTETGQAIEKREIYVQLAGLRPGRLRPDRSAPEKRRNEGGRGRSAGPEAVRRSTRPTTDERREVGRGRSAGPEAVRQVNGGRGRAARFGAASGVNGGPGWPGSPGVPGRARTPGDGD